MGLWRCIRMATARLPSLGARTLDNPAIPVRDPWPGDPTRGTRLMRGELPIGPAACALRADGWPDDGVSLPLRRAVHGFAWLRDLRALGTDGARARARLLAGSWIAAAPADWVAAEPAVAGTRIAAWLGHFDFFAASADDGFRCRLLARLGADAKRLSAALPLPGAGSEAFTALRGLFAASVALPDRSALLRRALRLLTPEIERQVLPDGCHMERSPGLQLQVLQDLVEIRALLQSAQVAAPAVLTAAIERLAPALRVLRHGDGVLASFNGTHAAPPGPVDLALAQAGRGGRAPASLIHGRFERLQAGRSLLLIDVGTPPADPAGLAVAHAGTLSFEFSVGRERMIVNCGALPGGFDGWTRALRATAAHSTLTVADTSSAEPLPAGLGRRPGRVTLERQDANGAHWLEASHDGYAAPFGVLHRRRLYMAENGEDLRGEDLLEGETGQDFAIRFHLHPDISAMPDDNAVVLGLAGGGTWRLRADGAALSVEPGVHAGPDGIEPSSQVVLTGTADGPQQVKWALTRQD